MRLCALAIAWASLAAAAQEPAPPDLARLHALIKPQEDEALWREVDWMPSTDIWAARQRAAKEGKPLLLWYMAGEPLGTC